MNHPADHAEQTRPEILVAATLHLMTHYMRSGCPRLAVCISRHLEYLAGHSRTDPTIRDVCVALQSHWNLPQRPSERVPLH